MDHFCERGRVCVGGGIKGSRDCKRKTEQTYDGSVLQNWPVGKNMLTLLVSGLFIVTPAVPSASAQVTVLKRPLLILNAASVILHGMFAAGDALAGEALGVKKGELCGIGESEGDDEEDALDPGDADRLWVGDGEFESVGP